MEVSLVFLGWAPQPSFWRLRAWGIFGDSGGTYDQVLGGTPPIFLYVSASCLKIPQALDLQKLNCGALLVQVLMNQTSQKLTCVRFQKVILILKAWSSKDRTALERAMCLREGRRTSKAMLRPALKL